MFSKTELLLLGFATIVDTVLLLVVLERVNRAQVAIWLRLLLVEISVTHAASFFHALMRNSVGSTAFAFDALAMTLMSASLLLLPSSMLHAAIRLNHTGPATRPRLDLRYGILYLPIALLPLATGLIFKNGSRDFIDCVGPMEMPYVAWLSFANIASSLLFLRARTKIDSPGASAFFLRLAGFLWLMTFLSIVYVALSHGTPLEPWVRIVVNMAPLVPAFLFVWYTLRQRLIPLVMERSLLYGATLVIVLLMHQLWIAPMADVGRRTWNIDLVLIEGAILVCIVIAYQPFRQRVSESLRYLFSRNVFQVRDATRQLSVELSRLPVQSISQLTKWFETEVSKAIDVQTTEVWLSRASSDAENSLQDREEHQAEQDIVLLFQCLKQNDAKYLDRGLLLDVDVIQAMERRDVLLAFRLRFQSVDGLIMLGPRLRSDRLAEEQQAALALVFDQFAATVHNRHQEMHRQKLERQSMQHEKLSILGILSGSLAHELRNPLSSIRTITALMQEDLGQDHQHAKDLSMILAEIDRLSQTSQRLLDFARPSNESHNRVRPDAVLDRLLYILGHFAKQQHVNISTLLGAQHSSVAASDATLSEILFNLIRNAIEAARDSENGTVEIRTETTPEYVVVTIADNGVGIDPALKSSIFQPFVTGKGDGTGLGLYVVAERVKELNGQIQYRDRTPHGTCFEVRLPCETSLP